MGPIRWRKWTVSWLVMGILALLYLRAVLDNHKSPTVLHRKRNERGKRNNFPHHGKEAAVKKYYNHNSERAARRETRETGEIARLRKQEQKLLRALSDSSRAEESLRKKIRALSIRSALKNHVQSSPASKQEHKLANVPTIFVVTPTFTRFVQKAELTRISQALKGVRKLHWIVVEDSKIKTKLVVRFLKTSGLNYTHLNIRTPDNLQQHKNEFRRMKPRGVVQRNVAITWLRQHVNPNTTPGVVYFADDDNTYDSRIFEEMRWVKRVGVCPVAFTGAARWAGPICKGGRVVSFHTNWGHFRPFPIDMAGFAINIKIIITDYPKAVFVASKQPGMLESSLLTQITSITELEPITANCSQVYVWHTRTQQPMDSISGERKLIQDGRPSNQDIET